MSQILKMAPIAFNYVKRIVSESQGVPWFNMCSLVQYVSPQFLEWLKRKLSPRLHQLGRPVWWSMCQINTEQCWYFSESSFRYQYLQKLPNWHQYFQKRVANIGYRYQTHPPQTLPELYLNLVKSCQKRIQNSQN